jgi:hypothetical protein
MADDFDVGRVNIFFGNRPRFRARPLTLCSPFELRSNGRKTQFLKAAGGNSGRNPASAECGRVIPPEKG